MRISGVWTASITPLKANLTIDAKRFASHVDWLLKSGNDGVAVFGSTGEANSFAVSERLQALEALGTAGIDLSRIIVGAGACATPDAVALAGHATRLGCTGTLVTPPFYYKGISDDGIFGFFKSLISGVGSELRVVLYHFPKLVAIGFSEDLIGRLVKAWPEVIVGLKDSSGDLERMLRLAAAHPSLSVLAGTERLLLDVLRGRGAGCLTASANLTSSLAARVVRTRDEKLQEQLTEARTALESAGFVAGLKQVFADASGSDDWLNIRPPLERLSDTETSRFRIAVSEFGELPNLA
jgi:4-hydroxy-tetrahydrodipicolinate synthase